MTKITAIAPFRDSDFIGADFPFAITLASFSENKCKNKRKKIVTI
jgi:hypothetical protein